MHLEQAESAGGTAVAERPQPTRAGRAKRVRQFHRRHDVLGVGVSVLNLRSALDAVTAALRVGRKGYVCVTGVHGVMVSRECKEFRRILNSSFLTTPDGMPMVWMGKWNRCPEIGRVYGPDLMLGVCEEGVAEGRTHFLLGGGDGVADLLAERLREKIPGVKIVGTCTPPFRPFSEEERADLVKRIAELKPDCIWVGLSTPKQERFMAEYLPLLDTKLMFGVGAAFDFHAGLVTQAPRWMQRSGMEWFFRLCMEPQRLWRRYLFNNTRFMTLVSGQLAKGRPRRMDTQQFAMRRAIRYSRPRPGAPAPAAVGMSVVVPMFNEAECVDRLVDSLESMQNAQRDRYQFEFVFVDDASTDDTVARVREAAQGRIDYRVVRHTENRGIAASIDTGLRASRHDLAASIDADLSYAPETLLSLAPLVKGDVVMATASPYHRDGGVQNLPGWRIAISRAASLAYRCVMPEKLSCYTCCVRVYNRRAVLACRPESGGFVGVTEFAWRIQRHGGRVAEAPAVLRPRVAGVSKMRTAKATVGHFRLLSRIAAARLVPLSYRPTDAPGGEHAVLEPLPAEA